MIAKPKLRKSSKAARQPDPDCKTMSVPAAGKQYFGMGRNASYAAAERGDIPTIQVGRLLRVPVQAMEKRLQAVE